MILRAFIIAAELCFVANASLAQTSSAAQVNAQDLDFFLIQAFHSKYARSRLALNHLRIQGQKQEAGFLVTSVLESYPAHRAGLNRGDLITTIDGQAFDPVTSFNRAAVFEPEP
ncbi:MAG: PDZ domain-containing protein, partial [Pseudomonadota bacterium]|nr:PDZ domain-containing protein [Pseudomonadota bacterium]